jgi:hypothetical protein
MVRSAEDADNVQEKGAAGKWRSFLARSEDIDLADRLAAEPEAESTEVRPDSLEPC